MGQNRKNFSNRDRNRLYSRDTQRQNFRPSYRDNCKIDMYNVEMIVGEEVIDVKIIIEMTVEIDGDKTLGEASVMIQVDQEKEA